MNHQYLKITKHSYVQNWGGTAAHKLPNLAQKLDLSCFSMTCRWQVSCFLRSSMLEASSSPVEPVEQLKSGGASMTTLEVLNATHLILDTSVPVIWCSFPRDEPEILHRIPTNLTRFCGEAGRTELCCIQPLSSLIVLVGWTIVVIYHHLSSWWSSYNHKQPSTIKSPNNITAS